MNRTFTRLLSLTNKIHPWFRAKQWHILPEPPKAAKAEYSYCFARKHGWILFVRDKSRVNVILAILNIRNYKSRLDRPYFTTLRVTERDCCQYLKVCRGVNNSRQVKNCKMWNQQNSTLKSLVRTESNGSERIGTKWKLHETKIWGCFEGRFLWMEVLRLSLHWSIRCVSNGGRLQ